MNILSFEDDVRTFWAKFRANVSYIWQRATAISAALWATIYAAWGVLSDDMKTQIASGYIEPKHVPLVIGGGMLISHFVTQGFPQPVLHAKVEAKRAETMAAANAATSSDLASMTVSKPMPVDIVTDHAALNTLPSVDKGL